MSSRSSSSEDFAEVLSAEDVAQVASLDRVREALVADARSWGARLVELLMLAERAERAGAQTRRTLVLAGSWQISQLTAERWLGQAERFHEALPMTLSMLQAGTLLRHQASVLLHRTSGCTAEVAAAAEAQVLPAGARECGFLVLADAKRGDTGSTTEACADLARPGERCASTRLAARPPPLPNVVSSSAVREPDERREDPCRVCARGGS